MTKTYYETKNCKLYSATFGGELTLFDFEGHHTLRSMANKIAREQCFDKQCKKNIELRNRTKNEGKKNT